MKRDCVGVGRRFNVQTMLLQRPNVKWMLLKRENEVLAGDLTPQKTLVGDHFGDIKMNVAN